MSKPEDISQEAWASAGGYAVRAAETALRNLEQEDFTPELNAIRVQVARAIMAAKAEEREACATLVVKDIEYFSRREDSEHRAVGAWIDPFKAADAIRKRGAP